ncbi:MAG: nucleotide pyrophosphohydrolase [Clostridiales bacterium]|jgi:NTP pyrophosphatase (non-canonical NTP hydrolase)|nr:nucleotide pyrophosphohydrolase [Clostridiales bacterium]
MAEFTFNDIIDMQHTLQERYKDRWEPLNPEGSVAKLLWLVGEICEVSDIIKKNGAEAANSDPALRANIVEELADVLMYYGDVLLCFGVTSDELRDAYISKFKRNMTRW